MTPTYLNEAGDRVDAHGNPAADLDDMTVDEMKAHADERGIDLGDATKKDDIKAAIERGSSLRDA